MNRTSDRPEGHQDRRKYVFVGGSPRSGTSLLGRNIARMEDCTGLINTGVFEDEGQFLQDVYLSASAFGGSSRCAFDPRIHRTDTSELLTPENIRRLKASWHAYWDNNRNIFVEKTPENFLMTRFLQAAFSNTYFVVIKRHPVPVSIAGQRWTVNITSLNRMFQHWLFSYKVFEEDKKYLKHVYELSYEDYIANPSKYHEEIAAFVGTRVPDPPKTDNFRTVLQQWRPFGLRVPERAMEIPSATYNKKYFDRWSYLLTKSPFRGYYRYLARRYESEFAKHGYSLIRGFVENEKSLTKESKISAILGPMYCLMADLGALLWRSAVRTRGSVKRAVKKLLPPFVLKKIRQARQNGFLERRQAQAAFGIAKDHLNP